MNRLKLNKDGKDCRNCKWKHDHMLYCSAAQCPSDNSGNGYHAFEPIKKEKAPEVSP